MRRIVLALAIAASLLVAACGTNGAGSSSGVAVPSLESPLATADTSVGGGASPSASGSTSPSP
jgi:predicted small secreted protein